MTTRPPHPRQAPSDAALDAVRAELAALTPPVAPAELLARWVDAVEASRVVARPARPRRLLGLVAAVVAILAVLSAGALAGLPVGPAGPARLAVTTETLPGAALAGLTVRDLGPLAPPDRLAGCLQGSGVPPERLLGARQVLLDDRPGVLLVLPASPARLRLLVVDLDCGAPGAGRSVLLDTTVPG